MTPPCLHSAEPGPGPVVARRPLAVPATLLLLGLLVFGAAPVRAQTAAGAAPASAAEPAKRIGRIAMPALEGQISEEARAAARQARQIRAEREQKLSGAKAVNAVNATQAESVAAPAARTVPAAPMSHAASTPAVPATPAADLAPAFALSTRPLRTHAEAEQLKAAVAALLGQGAQRRTEVLPQGSDWRVVSWPYADRRQANQARAQLEARGLRLEVLEF